MGRSVDVIGVCTHRGVVAVGHGHLVKEAALPVLGQKDLVAAAAERRGGLALEVVDAEGGLDLEVAQDADRREGLVIRLDREVAGVGELALDPVCVCVWAGRFG